MSVPLAMPQFARACRAFLRLAYPEGPDSIPERKRVYFDLPGDLPAADFLPPAPVAEGVGQIISGPGGIRGYSLRLGSATFPHLKLKLQLIDYNRHGLGLHGGHARCLLARKPAAARGPS